MRSSSAGASPFGVASLGITASNPFLMTLLETTAVLRHVTGSPGRGLLRRLRPVPDRSADGVPSPWTTLATRTRGQTKDGSRVHLSIARRRRHPTQPLRPRRGYPAAPHHGLPIRPPTFRGVPRLRNEGGGCASPPAQIRQVRAGASLRGVERRFLAYAFPPRSPHPRRLAVPTRHGFVGAACHPSRHLPRPAAPSFTALLRQDGGEGLSPPTRSTSASRRRGMT